MKREIRFTKELRIAGDEFAITGYATLYNNQSSDLGGFRESIKPGAFKRSLATNADVKCLFNHAPDNILGRTTSGTLKVSDDARGLKFRCALDPNNSDHKNIHSAIKRGDISECSFAFTVADGGQQWAEGVDPDSGEACLMRTLTDVDLLDVSAVTYPAYPNTSVDARKSHVMFPEGAPAEIRSAMDAFAAFRGLNTRKNPADEAYRIIQLRKAAASMVGGKRFGADGYPAPYNYASLAAPYDAALIHAQDALARCEDVDDCFDEWGDDDERCVHTDHKALREAHTQARAQLDSACIALATARMALARCADRKK